jgi:hypothetical protein
MMHDASNYTYLVTPYRKKMRICARMIANPVIVQILLNTCPEFICLFLIELVTLTECEPDKSQKLLISDEMTTRKKLRSKYHKNLNLQSKSIQPKTILSMS